MKSNQSIKIAVLNYSGNVGKTTLARYLLQPRMGNCPILFVESVNEGGDANNIKGKDFGSAMTEVLAHERVIMDIGSSNIEQVLAKVAELGDVLDDFDYLLVPTVPNAKQQADTIKTLRDLFALGVPASKMRVILNFAARGDDVERTFAPVLNVTRTFGIAHAVVHESEGFSFMSNSAMKELLDGGSDLRAEIAATPDKEHKRTLASALIAQRFVKGVRAELDAVFDQLFWAKAIST